ncbi:MAG: imelysin [Bacteroidales bacterium]|nr:imelysin [Bacteroidales bacterium]MBQ1904920.1 imelysin [Bacteroidales bacterium]MBQ4188477.1 imelysin [Bacteroidales bacterium]
MKRLLSLSVMALLGTVILGGCQKEPSKEGLTDNQKQMKAAVEQYVPNVVYSTYKALADETQGLYELLAAASKKGVNSITDNDINAICSKFLAARTYWEQSEAFLYGPATTFGIDPHIDTWPLDAEALAVALSNTAQMEMLKGEDGIAYAGAKLGAELLGFHGIEFILFRNGKNRTAAALKANEDHEAFEGMTVTGEQELIYATAVAGDLRDNCYRLYASWNPDAEAKYTDRIDEIEAEIEINGKIYGANMLGAAALGSSFETWEEVLSTILVGGCSNICAEVADVKMGNAHTGEDVNYIESPYSEKSFQDFIDNILSIQYSLYGALGASNPGAKSIYTLLGNLGYSDVNKIQTALKGAIDALKTCQGKSAFVKIYADACVQDAMDAVSALDDELNKAASWIVRQ